MVASAIAMVAAVAYFAGEKVSNNSIGRPWNGLLRALPLLVAAMLASALSLTLRKLRASQFRSEELAQANLELAAQAAIAHEVDERLSLMFHGNPLPIYVYDCESLRFLDVNEAAAAQFGYTRDEFFCS
jgi:PAS domain-containing protein